MTPPAAVTVADGPRGDTPSASPTAGPFVVNLCASTTPMALTQSKDPQLAKFKFFMSRRREDGRERFRLHMGYFDTLQEAEEWVGIAREFYPGAWAGEAPGKHLGARARSPAPAPSKRAATDGAAAASQRAAEPPNVPVLRAVQDEPLSTAAAPPSAEASPELVLELVESSVAPSGSPDAPRVSAAAGAARTAQAPSARKAPSRAVPPAPQTASSGRPQPSEVSKGSRGSLAATRPTAANAGGATAKPHSPPRHSRLDETQSTRQMPSAASAPPASQAAQSLSDSQVLRILEDRRPDGKAGGPGETVALLKPDDTGTRHALKQAVAQNAPVFFAVQLRWSVEPIDVSKVPPLAIFGAYTLYTVEGRREGRRWYGLRLGFFSDAISAKQVAHYVRSEFNSVAVVPVSTQERDRASGTEQGSGSRLSHGAKPARSPSPVRERLAELNTEFKLLDDEPAAPRAAPAPSAQPRAAAHTASAPKRTPTSRVRAGERRSPKTLEETLEILGADELQIDAGNDRTAKRRATGATLQARRNSPFAKFLDRLSERTHKAR